MTGQVGGYGHPVADVGERVGSHLATAVVTGRPTARGRVTAVRVREVVAGVRCSCDRTRVTAGHRRRESRRVVAHFDDEVTTLARRGRV